MKASVWIAALALVPLASACAQAQAARHGPPTDRGALEILLGVVERNIESAAEAMPADKYGFAPTAGEFRGVRTFGRQVKHLAATNYILAAAALGQDPPADAGDEAGPDSVNSKPQVLHYLQGSFAALRRATRALDDRNPVVKPSSISPLGSDSATRGALVAEALIHSYDHYGQMVEYLRMNGVVPPASRS
jgi:uncharacterized damage-inducible protein DinB